MYLLRRNRDRKLELEQDWSDKLEANEIDTFNAKLRNELTCKHWHPGTVRFGEM